jgi:putative SOS response-associated peptidase YedK
MCAGYTTPEGWQDIRLAAKIEDLLPLTRRYNIHPFAHVVIIREREAGRIETAAVQWWLVPHWAKDRRSKYPTFNARAETVDTKPSFREPFRRRRCLIPLDGFYERVEEPGAKKNRPWYICHRDRRAFLAAGIWDRWERDGDVLESMAMVTTRANALLDSIGHDRMPVILDEGAQELWLDPAEDRVDVLKELLRPWPSRDLVAWPVGYEVNDRTISTDVCIAPTGPARHLDAPN